MRISDWSSDVCSSDLQRPRRLSRCDIARHNLNAVRQFFDALHSDGHHLAMAVRCIDDDQIAFRIYQSFCPLQSLVRSEEHTSELQSLMRISYAVFCLKKKKHQQQYSLLNDRSNY